MILFPAHRSCEAKILLRVLTLLSASLFLACSGRGSAVQVSTSLIGEAERDIFNETGYPIVKEPVTLSAIVSKRALNGDFNQMPTIKRMKDKAGIQLDIQEIPDTSYGEKINLLFASGDLPDMVLGGGPANLMSYAGELVRPLDGYIENHMPNLKAFFEQRPVYRKMAVRSDGHIYNLPRVQEYPQRETPGNLFINKKWLDALGLEIPQTTEEFYQVLKAFKEQDPNGNGLADEIPVSMRGQLWWPYQALHSFSGSFTFPFDDTYFQVGPDQKLEFVPIAEAENFKEFVKWWQKLYQEDLVDIESFTQGESQHSAKGQAGLLGSFVSWFDEEVVGQERIADYVMLKPLKGPKGQQQWLRAVREFGRADVFLLPTTNQYPATTMRFLDMNYDPEYAWQLIHGPWDIVIQRLPGGKVDALPPPEGLTADEWRYQNTPAVNYPYGLLSDQYQNFLGPKSNQRKMQRYDELLPFLPAAESYLPLLNFSSDEDNELAVLSTDINDFFQQNYVNWITQGIDIEAAWPNFVAQLKNIGLERYIEIYQAAYDRFVNS